MLSIEYGLDVENNALYYIFDRDRESNSSKTIMNYFNKYHNSRDNDYEMNGLFLISYPCIESFMCNCYGDQIRLSCGKEAKKHVKKYSIESLTEENLCLATKELLRMFLKIINEKFSTAILDDFTNCNKKVFDYEENEYINKETYDTLSLFIITLIDLGIIEIEND